MPDTLFDSPQRPRMTPAVQWLMAANIGVYFLQLTLIGPDQIFRALGLSVGDLASGWWTPFTYMFVHAGLWHLAFNMFALWMFGPRVEESWSTRGFLYFYLWCGLGGAVAHLLLQRNAGLIGASAAVSGVMLAYALRWPDEDALARSVDGGDQSRDGSCRNFWRLGNRMVLAPRRARVRLDISANVFIRRAG